MCNILYWMRIARFAGHIKTGWLRLNDSRQLLKHVMTNPALLLQHLLESTMRIVSVDVGATSINQRQLVPVSRSFPVPGRRASRCLGRHRAMSWSQASNVPRFEAHCFPDKVYASTPGIESAKDRHEASHLLNVISRFFQT